MKQQETPVPAFDKCVYGTVLMSQGEQKCIGKYIEGNHNDLNRIRSQYIDITQRTWTRRKIWGQHQTTVYCLWVTSTTVPTVVSIGKCSWSSTIFGQGRNKQPQWSRASQGSTLPLGDQWRPSQTIHLVAALASNQVGATHFAAELSKKVLKSQNNNMLHPNNMQTTDEGLLSLLSVYISVVGGCTLHMVNVANNLLYHFQVLFIYPIEIWQFELLVSNCSQSHEKYAISGAKNHGMHTFSPADASLGVCMPKLFQIQACMYTSMQGWLYVTECTCRGTQLICYRKGKEAELSLQEWQCSNVN